MPTEPDITEQIKAAGGKVVEQPATDAGSWRAGRKEGFNVELPSGHIAKVRRTMDMMDLVRQGKIPNKLIQFVQKLIAEGGDPTKIEFDPDEFDDETLSKLVDFMDHVCCNVLISPVCVLPPRQKEDEPEDEYSYRLSVWEPPEGTISTLDLTTNDKEFLFQLAQGGTSELSTFRDQQETFVASVQDGGAVPKKAKRTAGAKR